MEAELGRQDVRDGRDGALDEDEVEGRARGPAGGERAFGEDHAGGEGGEGGAGEGQEGGVFFERDDFGSAGGEQGGAVSGPGADDEAGFAVADAEELDQAGDDHGLDEGAAALEGHVLIDVGAAGECGGTKRSRGRSRMARMMRGSMTLLGRTWLSTMQARAAAKSAWGGIDVALMGGIL